MGIKKFSEIEQEIKEVASSALEQIEESGFDLPRDEERFKKMLDNSYLYTRDKVQEIANTVEGIKEVGLEVSDPAVSKWLSKTLDVAPQEFVEFLDQAETGEEAKINILEAMETPKEVMEQVVDTNNNSVVNKNSKKIK